MINAMIGIVSYLPEDINIRNKRFQLLKDLLNEYDKFEIPVIIIAQNYKEKEIWELFNAHTHVIIKDNMGRLGITRARAELRRYFLEDTSYEYLIMSDDDIIVDVTSSAAQNYLNELKNHPDMFYTYKKINVLQMFGISRHLLSQVSFDTRVNPENGDGFEDDLFLSTLRKKFPGREYMICVPDLYVNFVASKDPLSTWYTNQDLADMRRKTEILLNNDSQENK